MKKFCSFPEIGQYRQIVKTITERERYIGKDEDGNKIYDHSKMLPVQKWTGTVKQHGTNAGVTINKDGEIWAQSRSNIITIQSDNAGFAFFVESKKDIFKAFFEQLDFNGFDYITIFGEWAGCLSYMTPILLSNGQTMPIGKIVNEKLDVNVLTYNFNTGKLEEKKVVGWYNNGKTDKWLKIDIKRRRRGGRSCGIIVTPNHTVYVKEDNIITEKMAGSLKVGDKVLVPGNQLTNNVKQFIMGTLLGDGSFAGKRNIVVAHSDDKQKFYNDFIENNFKHIFTSPTKLISGHGSNMRRFTSREFADIDDFKREMYGNGNKKQVTIDYLNKLQPLGLAVWYMDDGSLIKHNGDNRQYRCVIHCQGFGTDNVKLIRDWLNSKGFYCNTTNELQELGTEIVFTTEGAAAFLYTIAPYVINGFNYKLPELLQSIEKVSWWDHYLNEYEQSLIDTEITSIVDYEPKEGYLKVKYDIEVEDNHNYFANRTLVHNSNIQKGVAINGLPKMLSIFDIKRSYDDIEQGDNIYSTIDEIKLFRSPENQIFNVYDFKTYEIEIDFNRPEEIQNKIVELTLEVEDECPVGKYFGNIGIGEGIVFAFRDGDGNKYRFKSKGLKHSSSKVRTLASVDTEKIESVREFVEYAVTENRLKQGLEKVFGINGGLDIKETGNFLRWIVGDVIKEELDTLSDNGLEPKDVTSAISVKGRAWLLEKINKF